MIFGPPPAWPCNIIGFMYQIVMTRSRTYKGKFTLAVEWRRRA